MKPDKPEAASQLAEPILRCPCPLWDIPRHSLGALQVMLDGLAEQVAVIGPDGTILLTNEAWRTLLATSEHAGLDVGGNYHRFIEDEAAGGCKAAAAIREGMKTLYEGGEAQFKHSYSGFGPLQGRRISKVLSLVRFGEESYLFVSRTDVTELRKLKRQRRTLGTQLLRAQEEERKRIVRDLHDSTSQLLVGLQLSLARLRRIDGVDVGETADDCEEIVKALHAEIRTLSYLAHPPALEESSIDDAIRELAQGFELRTGIEVHVEGSELGRHSALLKGTIYRVVQEALTNVQRHADANEVFITLSETNRYLHLNIRDDGRGLGKSRERDGAGLGIKGMRGRVEELGGEFDVRALRRGTLVAARIPVGLAD